MQFKGILYLVIVSFCVPLPGIAQEATVLEYGAKVNTIAYSPISGFSASVIRSGSTAPHAVELGVNEDNGGHMRLFTIAKKSGTPSLCVLEAREYGGRGTVQCENRSGHLFSGGHHGQ